MRMDLHMHSTYSDGANTPEEMIETAVSLGYDVIAVTDHVWRTSHWVEGYARHLRELRAANQARIDILAGVEAKVINLQGHIDADPSVDAQVDLILGSMHRIPNDSGYYRRSRRVPGDTSRILKDWWAAFSQLLQNPRVDILAHPLAELAGFGIELDPTFADEVAERMASSGKLVEINVRHRAPQQTMIRRLADRGARFVISSDSHSCAALAEFSPEILHVAEQFGIEAVDIQAYLEEQRRSRG